MGRGWEGGKVFCRDLAPPPAHQRPRAHPHLAPQRVSLASPEHDLSRDPLKRSKPSSLYSSSHTFFRPYAHSTDTPTSAPNYQDALGASADRLSERKSEEGEPDQSGCSTPGTARSDTSLLSKVIKVSLSSSLHWSVWSGGE